MELKSEKSTMTVQEKRELQAMLDIADKLSADMSTKLTEMADIIGHSADPRSLVSAVAMPRIVFSTIASAMIIADHVELTHGGKYGADAGVYRKEVEAVIRKAIEQGFKARYQE